MAVTGAIFNSLSFGGVNSADYGIYITGEGVFNAPKRAVDMVAVPGRNGSIAIDQGHWENIDVTYPAGTFGMDEPEFATALSNFRNAIVSQIGYQRLSDTYHPDEYRMALYAEGLEAEPTTYNQAGEFELKFNCKPQRWLTDGETPVTVTSGDTLTNPTHYNASPLLAVEGNGNILFNGFTIEIESGDYGEITFIENDTFYNAGHSITIPAEYIKNGDTVTLNGVELTCPIRFLDSSSYRFYGDGQTPYSAPTDSVVSAQTVFADGTGPIAVYGSNGYSIITTIPSISFTIGTSETFTDVTTISGLKVTADQGATLLAEITNTVTETVAYDATAQTITFTQSVTSTQFENVMQFDSFGYKNKPSIIKSAQVDSTLSYLGNPTYVDCEIGEAYKIEDGAVISLNRYIDLGSDLPTLASGNNGITFDNTIESLEITPRWWKL